MNKVIIVYLLLFSLSVKAQFQATYNGFRTNEDKEFLVLNYEQVPVHKLLLLSDKNRN